MRKRKEDTARIAFDTIIGIKLRTGREIAGISMATIADALDLKQPAISRIENGQSSITVWQLHMYCSFCSIPITTIINPRPRQ